MSILTVKKAFKGYEYFHKSSHKVMFYNKKLNIPKKKKNVQKLQKKFQQAHK